MIEALVFDFDGVIIDTETSDFQTWADVFDSHGAHLDRSLWTEFIGRGSHIFDIYDHLEAEVGRPLDRDAIRAARRDRHMELVEASPVLPGVLDLLREVDEQGIPVGVASSSSRRWVVGHLERIGILDRFDSVLCRDDVSATKPDPELYTRSAEALGSSPARTVAIEDSPNGIAAAKAAGLFCVAVPNPMTRDLPTGAADVQVDSLSEITIAALRSWVAEAGSHLRPRRL